MIEILTHHHTKYVPSVKKNTNFFIKSTGETITFKTAESHNIQFGSDQLTVARVRSAIKKMWQMVTVMLLNCLDLYR